VNQVIALVDVDSMYASVELLFRPDLHGRPVVVCSNNDGAIITRNLPAKALGIKMGEPLFKVQHLVQEKGLVIFSSNTTLYGDLSRRMMITLESFAAEIEEYSVDEAFLTLPGGSHKGALEELGREIKARVYKDVGLPVSVGLSTTKTLAKLASRAAKKYPKTVGVVDLTDPIRQRKLLSITDVSDVWGVGSKLTKRLRALGIHTAMDLAESDPKDIRARFSVMLERTARELAGVRCTELETAPESQQQIVCSRSFGSRVTDKSSLNEALASFTATATERLRKQARVAKSLTIFIRTSPFSNDPRYSNSLTAELPYPCDDTSIFLGRVRVMLNKIWRDGYRYAKAGVMLSDFYDPSHLQVDLFNDQPQNGKRDTVMRLMDQINGETRGALRFGSQGQRNQVAPRWQMNQSFLSPRYTTRFSDLPIAKIR